MVGCMPQVMLAEEETSVGMDDVGLAADGSPTGDDIGRLEEVVVEEDWRS